MTEPRLDLRQLRAFQAAVEAGSLTAAAQRLHLTQPSLSAAIGKLEAQLGVTLLTRTSRGVEPTYAGRYLLDASTRIFGEVEETERALAGFGTGTRGTLTLAAVPALMWQRVPVLLARYAERAPEVEVRLVDPPPWAALDMLEKGTADAAAILVSRPEQVMERHRDSFDITDWGEVPLVAATPSGLFEPGAALEATSLAPHPLLVPRRTPALPSLPEAIDDYLTAGAFTPQSVRAVETIQTALPLVAAGLGIALIPDPGGPVRAGVDLHPVVPAAHPLRALVLTRIDARRDAALARLIDTIGATATSPGAAAPRP